MQIEVTVRGLPHGQFSSLQLVGPHFSRHLRVNGTRRLHVRHAGRYRLIARRIHVRRRVGPAQSGATGYPNRSTVSFTVKTHGTARVEARYSLVNPRVRRAPASLTQVVGDPMAPTALVMPRGPEVPQAGSVITSGPTADLPAGLVARVTSVTPNGDGIEAALTPASVADAVPLLSYSGDLELAPGPGSSDELSSDGTGASPRTARAASSCVAPKLLRFGAHLDAVRVREAFLGAWPPQMRLTLAVRTTERLGIALAAVGVNCDFDVGEAGPFQGAVPVGPVLIPVFATFPVKGGIHINGTLNAGTVNVASTTVAHVAAGGNENSASLHEEGSNVWLSGVLSLSGSARLSASIGAEAGIGVATAGNVHVGADFGPVFTWKTGERCAVNLNFGSLSGGVSAFGKSLHSPSFTPFRKQLWSGCSPEAPAPNPGAGNPAPGGSPDPGPGSGGGTGAEPGGGPADPGPITGTPSLSASDGGGSLAVQVMNFPLGTTYYFCHAGNAPDYPAGGTITATGQLTVVEHTQSFAGLCPGRSNAWIGLQGSDGHDYYSNQVDLQRPATPGASVSASNNNGQMFVQFTGFPLGTTYYFCHSGNSSDYPTGGVITAHGQITISSSNQSFASGLCSGRGNAWIGIQASDNHDYYSNQVDLYAPATPGASIAVFGSAGQMSLQVSGFPTGTTYYFCHAGDPSQYPTGGSIIGHGQINVSAPNQTFGPLCSGSGNAWIGIQATDGHDYYSNQITL